MIRICLFSLFFGFPAMAQTLTDAALQRILAAPEVFLEEMGGLILGYGSDQGIDAAGIDRFLSVQRAKVRAREMRRFWLADLDDDGQVTVAELSVLIEGEGAGARGRLWRAHERADGNGDGTVTLQEARAVAAVAVQSGISGGRVDAVRALMGFDADNNGFVSLRELTEAVGRLRVDT